jgi:hypothetical protein
MPPSNIRETAGYFKRPQLANHISEVRDNSKRGDSLNFKPSPDLDCLAEQPAQPPFFPNWEIMITWQVEKKKASPMVVRMTYLPD